MTLPANIRVNIGAPFPSLVKGGGLVAIAKNNGIWTVSLNFGAVAKSATVPDPANTYVPAWNALTGVVVMVPMGNVESNNVVTKVGGGGGQPVSPYAALPTDDVILVYAVPFTVTVDWSARTKPLRIVDQSAAASVANPISITPKAGQTQMATVNYSATIDGNGGSISLTPLPDGSGAY